MADLPSIKDLITVEQTNAFAAGTTALIQSMGSAANWIQDNIILPPLGTVIESMLTEAQFQAAYGTGWVLCDGASCSGSDYETLTGKSTVPDARGTMLRGKKNSRADGKGRGIERVLGTYVPDYFDLHDHSATITKNEVANSNGTNDADDDNVLFGPTGAFTGSLAIGNITGIIGPKGNETRCRNVTMNYFIRID